MMNLDGYCEVVNILKNSSDYQNVFKTLFYPLQIDSYMEAHKIYEIVGDLLVRVGMERLDGDELIDFMIKKLIEISSKKYKVRNAINIEFNNCSEEGLKYIKKLASKFKIPIIFDDNQALPEILKEHLITCDFKESANEEHLMRISTVSNNSNNIPKSLDCNLKLKKAIDMKLCYNNLKYVIQSVRHQNPLGLTTNGKWNRRVLLVGRVGSGRKTQAAKLTKEFGLILLDIDRMLMEYEQQYATTVANETHSMGFWGYIQEILLKPQCLHNGYAIVSNVISRIYLEMLMETFIHRPNLIIFIEANENKCRQRILKQKGIYLAYHGNATTSTSSSSPTSTSRVPKTFDENVKVYLDYQMNLYDLHKKEFRRYFTSTKDLREKILYVNGNGSVSDVKSCIWAHLCRK